MKFDHYIIRFLEQRDAEKFFQLVDSNRKRLEDGFAGTLSKTKTLAATEIFMADKLANLSERKYYPFLIIDTTTDNIIGFIDLKNIDWQIPKGEFGCFMSSTHQGKNVATKAFAMVINYIFEELKFRKLFLRTQEKNGPARKLAERCGFEVEGLIHSDYITANGEIVDLLYYGLLNPKLNHSK